jgi:hypothetical protein
LSYCSTGMFRIASLQVHKCSSRGRSKYPVSDSLVRADLEADRQSPVDKFRKLRAHLIRANVARCRMGDIGGFQT